MLHKFRRLLITLAAITPLTFFSRSSSANIFSTISYGHGIGVQNGAATLGGGGISGTTLPVSKTVSVNNGPSIQATYTFSDSGNFASLEIRTAESLNGPMQSTDEGADLDKFSFSQAVSYHFVFQDTVSAGLIASDDIDCTNGTLNNVFLVPQVENSSYESDGVLAAGNVYGFSESFDLSNFVAGQPAVASGTSDLLFTFTAVSRAVLC